MKRSREKKKSLKSVFCLHWCWTKATLISRFRFLCHHVLRLASVYCDWLMYGFDGNVAGVGAQFLFVTSDDASSRVSSSKTLNFPFALVRFDCFHCAFADVPRECFIWKYMRQTISLLKLSVWFSIRSIYLHRFLFWLQMQFATVSLPLYISIYCYCCIENNRRLFLIFSEVLISNHIHTTQSLLYRLF